MTNCILLIAAILCVGSSNSTAQTLPKSIRKLIDAEFKDWRFEQYATPDSAAFPNAYLYLDPNARNVFKCRLNLDSIPDYAVRICVPGDTGACEYILAAVSKGSSFTIFRVDSSWMPHQDQMLLSPRGRDLNTFGELDSTIARYGRLSADGEFIRFPTDCINKTTIVESCENMNYVFIRDRFYEIISGD